MSAIETAKILAVEFANQLNSSPAEMQNWSRLDSTDDLPSEDYAALVREFGECSREMENAYKKSFNSTIKSK